MAKGNTQSMSFENIDATLDENGVVILRIDTRKSLGTTKGGNESVATTRGNKCIGDVMFGINAYRKVAKQPTA